MGETHMADFNNTPDTTSEFSQEDIQKNKVFGILAYFGILVLIPIFAAKESKFAQFHANQGLVLLIIEVAIGILNIFLSSIAFLGLIVSLLSLVIFVFSILGIVNAAQGKAKELPLIGTIKILK